MIFTDSHCHLAMVDPGSVAASLAAARSAGVRAFLVPATNLADAPGAVAVAAANDGVWSAVGFHPHEAKDCDAVAFDLIASLARSEKVVAIGEIGLDYHYMHSPRETQREVFMRHVALARELNLPVIIHNRESTADLLELVASSEASGSRGVLHSFTEDYEVASTLLDRGFYISFSGILTFRTAAALREVARRLPHDRVLIETDTPFLAPVPHRGKENQPAFVVEVASMLASLWNLPLAEVAAATSSNFEAVFGVTIPL
jgi:TatD DNase family protein